MPKDCCEPTAKNTAALSETGQPPAAARRHTGLAIAGGIAAAIGAASCCVVPFALFSIGVSGAWIGNLTALEPLQPVFAAAGAGFIGFGAYRVYARRKEECAPGSYCATQRADALSKIGLTAASALLIGALGFPYLIQAIAV